MKNISYFLLLFILGTLVACVPMNPEPEIVTPVEVVESIPENLEPLYFKAVRQKKVAAAPLPVPSSLVVIGEEEPVFLQGMRSPLAGRIDTGATTSSVNAINIVPFERDGKSWVSFTVKNTVSQEELRLERAVSRTVLIKRHGEESQRRVVIKLDVRIGEKTLLREFTLTDRSAFTYPTLIGRNVLSGVFAVDVSLANTTSAMQEGTYDN